MTITMANVISTKSKVENTPPTGFQCRKKSGAQIGSTHAARLSRRHKRPAPNPLTSVAIMTAGKNVTYGTPST
jgi:hypothetical protein